MWDLPPPELSGSLESFQAEFGLFGSHDHQVISIDKGNSRQFSQSPLEEATTYVFVVRGLYEGGVVGEDAVVIVTTLEDGMYCMRYHVLHVLCVPYKAFHHMILHV